MSDATQTARAGKAIRDLIISGVVLPGERLAEVQLADRLNMSRTPVRSALNTLSHEGLVESLPGRGYAVASFAADDLRHAVELRGLLEGTAARQAAERGAAIFEVDQLNRVLQDIDALFQDQTTWKDHVHEYVDLNEEFHRLLIESAQNPVLARLYEQLIKLPFASPSDLVVGYWHLPGSFGKFTAAQHQHWAIVESIAAGRGTRAEFLGREHAEITTKALGEMLRSGALSRDLMATATRRSGPAARG